MAEAAVYEGTPAAYAGRFNEYLEMVRQVYPKLSVSRLAEWLGYADARFVDALEAGREYFHWDVLDDFCDRASVNAAWLKHGEGQPFAPDHACRSRPKRLLAELEARPGRSVCFVRSDCRYGRVGFIVRHSELVWRVYDTGLHLSGENGAGGARMLVELHELLRKLNRTRIGDTMSLTLPLAEFESLVRGSVFPGAVLRGRRQCFWADDFPDAEDGTARTRARFEAHGEAFLEAQAIVRAMLESERYA